MSEVVLIDNYDSFTWNLYQYLSLQGAAVTVHRSQDLSIEELLARHPSPSHVVISPGPGHPLNDSGISIPAIKAYAGKVPILGVCMGLQCIYAAYGGDVDAAGEIVHGKTSEVLHDGQGVFRNLRQGLKSTRYHSLAGNIKSLPDVLEVTSRTKTGVPNEIGDIVMGIRHKDYAIEAVQYHPESILSEEGQSLLANFLSLKGGRWSDNPGFRETNMPNGDVKAGNGSPSVGSGADSNPESRTPVKANSPATILTKIAAQRTLDVDAVKRQPGTTPADYASLISLNATPPIVSLYERLQQQVGGPSSKEGHVALMAEVKRASPSKGNILPPGSPLSSAGIALSYALAGASVISVLTEPKWFKGCLEDMRAVRAVVDALPNRPAILRKDFILDPYQIDEARIFGADTVLLIVAMLDDATLQILYDHAISRGMEPLVEVNNGPELERALAIGARVIGVNNRNLHDFQVDMATTSRVADIIKEKGAQNVILCALSGIASRQDVTNYMAQGVSAVLVGETLMKANDKDACVRQLLGLQPDSTDIMQATDEQPKLASPPDALSSDPVEQPRPEVTQQLKARPLIKICGIKTVEAALCAADNGADFIGLIFAPKSKRCVNLDRAREIVSSVRNRSQQSSAASSPFDTSRQDWFSFQKQRLANSEHKPLIVGVFQNQSLEYVTRVADTLRLDLVQLHGQEPLEWCRLISKPVIKVFHVSPEENNLDSSLFAAASRPGFHALPLFDAKASASAQTSGGSGKTFDWKIAAHLAAKRKSEGLPALPMILAGGLSIDNVQQAISEGLPFAIDASGSLETDGEKDCEKIKAFLQAINTT